MKPPKRKLDLLVLSDIHLGTYGCHANELLRYLKSIDPKQVVLNGDIIDIWQFSKRYWPKSHMRILKHILGWVAKGKKVHYITGNHDEMLRKFVGFKMGSLEISNKLILDLKGEKAWFFHGDVFDITMQHSKWLAKLGALGYDILILINRLVNWASERLGRGKISLSKRVKNGVKSAVSFINNFEKTAAEIAIENGYEYVICGHIHQPKMRSVSNDLGTTTYLNSGDWIENLSALEFHKGKWKLYQYHNDVLVKNINLDPMFDENKLMENGAAFDDQLNGTIVRDMERIWYLRDHLNEIERARNEGAKVTGYFVWTLLDNFEWAEGYRPRFGLIYVDFKTQMRTIKHSALWYTEHINK